ncbi:uncharacterized protein LOC142639946 [Castanea sativa]|uniref:uncharacterized protein LOC142639946 n=1 Tax=Castanea sativa TaxID=21020 RepID=UPI003F650128
MGNHILLFTFDDELDADRVLLGESWTFDKYLIVLRRYEEDNSLRTICFNTTRFWVQVHDLPPRHMIQEAMEALCQPLGQIIPSLDKTEVDDGNFMRVRVELDITKPLCRGRKVTFDEGKDGWVLFEYERLPTYYCWCGLLSHVGKDCDRWVRSKGTLASEDVQFGAWLKAEPTNMSKWKVVMVEGFDNSKSNSPKDHFEHVARQEQVQCDVDVHQAALIDD